MPPSILGLHHVTATVDDAQADLDFCADTLGLRLVKQTVNFDNHSVYHFYYGDQRGTPGTIWTTFPYKNRGVRVGRKGAGQITATALSVPADALEFWADRLRERGATPEDAGSRLGEPVLSCTDPSGLRFELVGASEDDRSPWTTDEIEAGAAVRGLHSVTLSVAAAEPTVSFLQDLLGFEILDTTPRWTRLGVAGRPGTWLDVHETPDAAQGLNGLGTVHHVALAVATPHDQLTFRAALVDRGVSVTRVMDRQYFQSIYFREPGGVLLEIATTAPGFDVDEPVDTLGRHLKLPPWEEPNRSTIESALPKIRLPG